MNNSSNILVPVTIKVVDRSYRSAWQSDTFGGSRPNTSLVGSRPNRPTSLLHCIKTFSFLPNHGKLQENIETNVDLNKNSHKTS